MDKCDYKMIVWWEKSFANSGTGTHDFPTRVILPVFFFKYNPPCFGYVYEMKIPLVEQSWEFFLIMAGFGG